jgi:outer membrane receptor protein involved in Fe transport
MVPLRKWLAWCALEGFLAAAASSAQPSATLHAHIAPQTLAHALATFANQTGLQVIYLSDIVDAQQTKGASAGLAPVEALTRLLDGTGLRFEFLNARTVRIFAAPTAGSTALGFVRTTSKTRRGLSAPGEVVINATRAADHPNAAPMSITVWTQDSMQKAGIKGMTEIAALTPGVEFDFTPTIGADGYTNLIIRGVTARHGVTTSVFIDDTSLPAARSDTFGRSFPSTFDLERVEVIRGPQGVLLGQGTLGGAVRFFFSQPSLTTSSMVAHTEVASTARSGASYELGSAIGGPAIAEVLGFRASGWYRSEGGYVDHFDRFTDLTIDANANRLVSKSARVAVTWAPTSSVQITPSLTYQSDHQHSQSAFFVDASDPKSGVLRNGSLVYEPNIDSFHLASVKLSSALRFAQLSSVTSYFDRRQITSLDFSEEFPASPQDAWIMPWSVDQHAFSQEVRLSSADAAEAPTWTAGLLYATEHKREKSAFRQVLGEELARKTTFMHRSQLEGFGQISLRAGRHVTVSGGVRVSRSRYEGSTEVPSTLKAEGADHAVTPKLDLQYQTDQGSVFYLTASKGYRSGGVYPPLAGCDVAPVRFPADTLWSYEVGARTQLLGGRVRLEPSVFHIRWSNEQPDVVSYRACGPWVDFRSRAVSNGFDLSAKALLTERLQLGLAMGYQDAHYTRTLEIDDQVVIHRGDALGSPPQVPSPWTITASIDYRFPLSRELTAELRADDNFHSRNPGPYVSDNPASPSYWPRARANPDTNILNLRATLRWRAFDVGLFVDNALDAQPTLGYTSGCAPCQRDYALTLRPRTVGITASARY